jgi:hypothetical protein
MFYVVKIDLIFKFYDTGICGIMTLLQFEFLCQNVCTNGLIFFSVVLVGSVK